MVWKEEGRKELKAWIKQTKANCIEGEVVTPYKKVHEFPVSSRDVTNQAPPGQELFSYDVIIPAQGEFGSDIPAGDGKLENLFFYGV